MGKSVPTSLFCANLCSSSFVTRQKIDHVMGLGGEEEKTRKSERAEKDTSSDHLRRKNWFKFPTIFVVSQK